MTDAAEFVDILYGISERINEEMSEKDVENAYLNEGFYNDLGYRGAGYDLRSEWSLPDNRRPDYVTLDENESVTAVYEFKTSGEDLDSHTDQLFHYVDVLKADYGVLTNGEEFHLYRRDGSGPLLELTLADATEAHARDLIAALEKPDWDITNPESVNDYLTGLDPVGLDSELGQEHFFDTFRLEEGSPFADLVVASMDLLEELRDGQEAKFVKGAYDFWDASYASEPDEVPDSWDTFVDGNGDLKDFMFCLESGHALLARLLLAKATEDHDFFPDDRGLRRYFDELQGFSDEINLDAYPVAANGLMEDMHQQLVESLFEDDIFIWWTDGYQEETSRLHANPYNRFRDVAQEGSNITRVSPATKERFSRAIAHVFFSVLKFDFAAIEGDPLGDLYQRYFDPETRKALGEFYTPQPVIEYIMDGVGYDVGVSNERLIDPSCGSGTFLVEAVNRYLEDVRRYEDDPDWEEHLTELCTRPRIVGLDIHPFAVLMAQIRFMVAILPEYRNAKRQNSSFTIRRLPIFRTDTLRNERELTGTDLGDDGSKQMTFEALTEDEQDVLVPVPLPVEVDNEDVPETERDGDFLLQRVRMPKFDTIRLEAGVPNFGEYFAALQGVLDVVKYHMTESLWEYHGGLEEGVNRYTSQEYEGIEEFFEPYVDNILETVQYLREEHGDGRLFKMFEDSVLALVVKNYMEYEYVVGNPPYVRIQYLPDDQKEYLDTLYDSATGNYDLYCPFYERGLNWLTEGTGKLGYITPNQFMVTDYGEGLREVILERSQINEVYDFRDSGVFEDATNYPAILILEDESDESAREENDVRCVRVKANVDDDSGRELDEAIIKSVRDHRRDPGYSDDYIDVFDFPQKELDDGYWALMPPEELQVFNKLEDKCDKKVEDITDAVFQGIRTSSNKVYIVDVLDADRVESSDEGETVTVAPIGGSGEFEIETDLLRPFLQGDEVTRWRGDWSGLHVVHPYYAEEVNGELKSGLYSQEHLQENLPKTWDFFLAHKETLESREGGRKEGEEDWYGYIYPKNLGKFEVPKIIQAHISEHAAFMIDEQGTWYFTTAYGTLLTSEYRDLTEEIACELNSKALDYYFKHITTVKAGGYYEYRSQYVEKLPCVTNGTEDQFTTLRETASEITNVIDLESKTERFPEAYLGDFDGELEYIDYEWQTRRYPVNASVDEIDDDRFAVTAGRSDEITDPRMEASTKDVREQRAKYVHAAVDGRKVKKGEETSIPIPRDDDDVLALLDRWETDKQTVEETNIEELEAEIDGTVYDLFDLTDEERKVIEDYLEVF
ncbi:Eco57I restriction-modification methylase domain-containing protein [Natronorubrum texcoconense]|uniref:site-specific DNA-methyltransferase (adenine-specific) n=1 Tax=Natronorubrum texcoconense TaxID=1095776 RepID=A0A1G8XJC5_9EURY|nr:N-6 DNA methylase [Natronorubrum texcoconense]SDJ90314.1 Type I restriction enzyme R protein N terminus (HSDR_N) [Natronorubrum texcoconense]